MIQKPRATNGTFAPYKKPRKPRPRKFHLVELRAELGITLLNIMGGILFGFALSTFVSH
jgi:hypothetical protein